MFPAGNVCDVAVFVQMVKAPANLEKLGINKKNLNLTWLIDTSWCGHCKKLAPKYALAAQRLKEEGSHILLAKVNCEEEPELEQQNEIRGYPSLKFFRNGIAIDYRGQPNTDSIVAWLKRKTGPNAAVVTAVSDLDTLIADNDVAIVGFFGSGDKDMQSVFNDVAAAIDDHPFAIVGDESIAANYNISLGSIILFKQFDEKVLPYYGSADAKNLELFVKIHSIPLIFDYVSEKAGKIFGGVVRDFVFMFYSKSADSLEKHLLVLSKLAKDYRGKFIFSIVDIDEEENERLADFFGITAEEAPVVRLMNLVEKPVKYKPLKDEISEKNLRETLVKKLKDQLEPLLKSESIPESSPDETVRELVGFTFEKIVFDTQKDVVVMFYTEGFVDKRIFKLLKLKVVKLYSN